MSEIKVVDHAVDGALTSLKQSAQDFESDLTIDKGQNQLNLVDKIEEINQQLDELVNSYRALLLQNEKDTRNAVEALKEADRLAASGLRRMM